MSDSYSELFLCMVRTGGLNKEESEIVGNCETHMLVDVSSSESGLSLMRSSR